MASDMGWRSECQRDGFLRAPSDEGGELEDTDVERVAGAERRAQVGGLLGARVDRAGRGRCQHPLQGCAVEDLDLVGFQFLGQWHLEPAPAVGGERSGSACPTDRQIAGNAWRSCIPMRGMPRRMARTRRRRSPQTARYLGYVGSRPWGACAIDITLPPIIHVIKLLDAYCSRQISENQMLKRLASINASAFLLALTALLSSALAEPIHGQFMCALESKLIAGDRSVTLMDSGGLLIAETNGKAHLFPSRVEIEFIKLWNV